MNRLTIDKYLFIFILKEKKKNSLSSLFFIERKFVYLMN